MFANFSTNSLIPREWSLPTNLAFQCNCHMQILCWSEHQPQPPRFHPVSCSRMDIWLKWFAGTTTPGTSPFQIHQKFMIEKAGTTAIAWLLHIRRCSWIFPLKNADQKRTTARLTQHNGDLLVRSNLYCFCSTTRIKWVRRSMATDQREPQSVMPMPLCNVYSGKFYAKVVSKLNRRFFFPSTELCFGWYTGSVALLCVMSIGIQNERHIPWPLPILVLAQV